MYIGVDGGGTKTTVALADEQGNIVARVTGGPSSPRNMGIDATVENIDKLIKEVEEGEIVSSFIALPGVEEEYAEEKEKIKEELIKRGLKGRVTIGSDQLSAFRSGTEEEDGVVVIAGTGSVVHGWREGESVSSGWGYLADEGSAFWIGIEAFRSISKELDGRREKTKITEILFDHWKINSGAELRRVIYSDFINRIPQISLFVEMAKGDLVAEDILRRAGEELSLSANTVINNLKFKDPFPLVVSGGVFQSSIVYTTFKAKVSPLAVVTDPIADPVKGAVSLALLS